MKTCKDCPKETVGRSLRCVRCKLDRRNKIVNLKRKIERSNKKCIDCNSIVNYKCQRCSLCSDKRKKKLDYNHRRTSSWKSAGIKDMTIDRYDQLLEEQNGCCGICGRHHSEFKKKLAADHNHDNGDMRGLLCENCNNGLGRFQDDIDVMCSAVSYMRQYE